MTALKAYVRMLFCVPLITIVAIALPNFAHAATVTWSGLGTTLLCGLGNESDVTCQYNWVGDSAPGENDVARFTATSVLPATIDTNWNVGGIEITSLYSGTITQDTGVTVTVGSLNFSQAAGTFTGGNSAIDINGNFSISGGTFTNTSGSLTVSGNWAKTGGTFTSGATAVTFDGTGTQTINTGGTDTGSDFQNLTKSNSGTLQLVTNNLDVDGTLTIASSTTLDINAKNITAATLSNSGTLQLQGGETASITTMDTDSGTVTYTGTSSYTSLAVGNSYYNLTLNGTGGTFAHNASLDVNGNLTITAGTLSSGGNAITLAGNWSNSGTYTSGSNTVTFDGASDQTITTASQTFNALTLNNTGSAGSDDVIISGTLDIDGALTITDGDLDISTNDPNITLAADVSIGTNGTIDNSAYTGTWTFDGAGTDTVTDNTTSGTNFRSVTVDGTSSKVLQLSSGANTPTFTFTTLTIGADDTISLNGENTTISTLVNNGTFQLQGGETVSITTMDTDSGTVLYVGTSTYTSLKAGNSYYNLTFNGSGGAWTMDAGLDANGSLTITNGTLATGNFNITLAGDWSNSGTFTEGTGTVTFDGSTAQALTGETFYNLTINNSAGTPSDSVDVDSSAAVTVTNTLTVSDGQFSPTTASDFSAVTITTNGILKPDSSASVTISGNFTNSGTFTANSGSVTFDGTSQTLSGSTAFYNFTKTEGTNDSTDETLTFTAGTIQTITNTWTLDGRDANDMINLVSSSPGTVWTINPQGTRTLDFIEVTDSTNANATLISCSSSCTGISGNTNWQFDFTTPTSSTPGESSSAGIGPLYSEDGSDNAPIALEGTTKQTIHGVMQNVIAAVSNKSITFNARPIDSDQLRTLRLRIGGRYFTLKKYKNTPVYNTPVRLIGILGTGIHNYALTADYGITTRTTYGVVSVRENLTPYVDELFQITYGRAPTKTEQKYWSSRIAKGDKKTKKELLNAIRWHKEHRKTNAL